ncbi:YdcF family protein [Rhizobium mesosinicum]|uniref:YdcF family protein n=1 Tax=Rhizobium mesosinicum TaxID=335017 RepID=A0ABS7H029_9HYPH|nr:YdcF family protein [Rhizobium mesosinicum]MBW9055506.1 YdcF family protein [Rhizobium mesosinicum]
MFVFAKLFWIASQPVTICFLLMAFSLLLMVFSFRRLAVAAGLLSLVLIFVSFYTTSGALIVQELEDRFPRPAAAPADATCIVLLGGGIATKVDGVRGGYNLDDAADRYIETVRLAGVYPNARIIMSGGDGSLLGGNVKEADVIRRMFDDFHIDPARVEYDAESRDTYENAINTKAILQRLNLNHCLLVTSGFHMPRAVAIFRNLGMDVTPWVADYRTTGRQGLTLSAGHPIDNADLLTTGLREWIGIVAYYFAGRVSTLYPQ